MFFSLKKLRAIAFVFSVASFSYGDQVELNVVPSGRASFGAAQEWMRALSSLKSARVRSDGQKATRPEAKWVGSTLYITGVIDSNNALRVPGQKFSLRQTSALSSWIESQRTLKSSGPKEVQNQRFGLTMSQLEGIHTLLKPTVTKSTLDKAASDVVRTIVRAHSLPLKMSRQDLNRLSKRKINTEWQGFSIGTVVAALLRPDELVLEPIVAGGKIELRAKSERLAKDGWPVGWESKLKKDELVPKIFDVLPLEIYDTPIADVMKAIEGRVETPIIFDTGLLAAAELDPATTKVTFNSNRTYYGKIIRLAASKAKMRAELKVDERGKPFFWVTHFATARRPKK